MLLTLYICTRTCGIKWLYLNGGDQSNQDGGRCRYLHYVDGCTKYTRCYCKSWSRTMIYDIALCRVLNEIKSAPECVLMYSNLQHDTIVILIFMIFELQYSVTWYDDQRVNSTDARPRYPRSFIRVGCLCRGVMIMTSVHIK